MSGIFLEQDSSAVAVRAVSSALRGEMFTPLKLRQPLPAMLGAMSRLSKRITLYMVSKFSCSLGIDIGDVVKINSTLASRWVVEKYPPKEYNAVLVGAPSGAVAHLASLLRAPFLTQHFLIGIRHPRLDPDDVHAIVGYGLGAAKALSTGNGDLEVIVHYDPVHDRFLSSCMNTVRIKLAGLTRAYREFIEKNLSPEGTIFFLNVEYSWRQLAVEERIHVQIGGLGGISDEEYLYGSEEIDRWLESLGSKHRGGWILEDYSVEEMPESEWGTYPGLGEELREFAGDNGYRFVEIRARRPEDISVLVAELYLSRTKRDRWFFDNFTSINPTFNLETGTIPVWLPFNCRDSYEFAERFLKERRELLGPNATIYYTLTPNFIVTPDQVEARAWRRLFSSYGKPVPVAVNESIFPVDALHFYSFEKQLKALSKKLDKRNTRISASDVLDYLKRNKLLG